MSLDLSKLTTVHALVLATMDRFNGRPATHAEIAYEGHRRPSAVYDALCELEKLGMVTGTRSTQADRFGRPKTSTWVVTKNGDVKTWQSHVSALLR